MKTYLVTINLVVNSSRDVDLEVPELKSCEFTITAENKQEAIKEAKKLNTSGLSDWDSYAEEV